MIFFVPDGDRRQRQRRVQRPLVTSGSRRGSFGLLAPSMLANFPGGPPRRTLGFIAGVGELLRMVPSFLTVLCLPGAFVRRLVSASLRSLTTDAGVRQSWQGRSARSWSGMNKRFFPSPRPLYGPLRWRVLVCSLLAGFAPCPSAPEISTTNLLPSSRPKAKLSPVGGWENRLLEESG